MGEEGGFGRIVLFYGLNIRNKTFRLHSATCKCIVKPRDAVTLSRIFHKLGFLADFSIYHVKHRSATFYVIKRRVRAAQGAIRGQNPLQYSYALNAIACVSYSYFLHGRYLSNGQLGYRPVAKFIHTWVKWGERYLRNVCYNSSFPTHNRGASARHGLSAWWSDNGPLVSYTVGGGQPPPPHHHTHLLCPPISCKCGSSCTARYTNSPSRDIFCTFF